jgi:uncharacterized protein
LAIFQGGTLDEVNDFHKEYKDDFTVFGSPDFKAIDLPEHEDYFVSTLRKCFLKGMRGIKIFKTTTLTEKDKNGNVIRIDDIRFKKIWETAAELKMPVLIYMADPIAFFDPVDERNERLEELINHPEWSFYSKGYPTIQKLMKSACNLLEENPDNTFVFAHMLIAEDLFLFRK